MSCQNNAISELNEVNPLKGRGDEKAELEIDRTDSSSNNKNVMEGMEETKTADEQGSTVNESSITDTSSAAASRVSVVADINNSNQEVDNNMIEDEEVKPETTTSQKIANGKITPSIAQETPMENEVIRDSMAVTTTSTISIHNGEQKQLQHFDGVEDEKECCRTTTTIQEVTMRSEEPHATVLTDMEGITPPPPQDSEIVGVIATAIPTDDGNTIGSNVKKCHREAKEVVKCCNSNTETSLSTEGSSSTCLKKNCVSQAEMVTIDDSADAKDDIICRTKIDMDVKGSSSINGEEDKISLEEMVTETETGTETGTETTIVPQDDNAQGNIIATTTTPVTTAMKDITTNHMTIDNNTNGEEQQQLGRKTPDDEVTTKGSENDTDGHCSKDVQNIGIVKNFEEEEEEGGMVDEDAIICGNETTVHAAGQDDDCSTVTSTAINAIDKLDISIEEGIDEKLNGTDETPQEIGKESSNVNDNKAMLIDKSQMEENQENEMVVADNHSAVMEVVDTTSNNEMDIEHENCAEETKSDYADASNIEPSNSNNRSTEKSDDMNNRKSGDKEGAICSSTPNMSPVPHDGGDSGSSDNNKECCNIEKSKPHSPVKKKGGGFLRRLKQKLSKPKGIQ